MPLQQVLNLLPTFVLVFFRVAGLMLSAPLFGSARVPRRVKVLMSLVMAVGLVGAVARPVRLPDSTWALTAGLAGELVFGLVMGLSLSLSFIAVNWAGEVIGQQMGLNMAETFDPQFGRAGSLVGDMYFMFILVIFLICDGHHAMLKGLRDSFASLPLLSVGPGKPLFLMLVNLLHASTCLAIKLAAPLLLTLLVVDLALGFIGRTMPQMNVMAAGMSLKSAVGVGVLILCLSLTSNTMRRSLIDSIDAAVRTWRGGIA